MSDDDGTLPACAVADDDMSDDDGTLQACAVAQPEAPKEQPVMLRIAACKAQIAKLEEVKKAKMGEEDYLGAQQAKDQIKQQEQALAEMRQRLNEVPTPFSQPRVSLAF